MLECVPNVSEGRDDEILDQLEHACSDALLDRHVDVDHHRSVFTLAGASTGASVRSLAVAVAELLDVSAHRGAHPRLGALDVVPFVALDGSRPDDAVEAARSFAAWAGEALSLPVFLYDRADPSGRSLPTARRDAFVARAPDFGPWRPHPRLGAVAVGAREPLVAVNCELARDDLALARSIARQVRERDGGLPGVRALGIHLDTRAVAQVSMNLVALEHTGIERACRAVDDLARASGSAVAAVELVGLLPDAELARCSTEFRRWARLDPGQTIGARLGARGVG